MTNHLTAVGLRINLSWERLDKAIVERYRALPVAIVGDVSNRQQAFPAGFLAYGGRKTFAGPAFTVRVRPGDNLFVHRALDLAQPGDVLVVDAGGGMNNAIIGAMMSRYARTRGIEAIVIDGAIRDVAELAEMDIAVAARGATPNGPFKSGPGEIGFAVGIAGLSIAPGDLLLGDMDGVLTLPRADAVAGIAAAEAKLRQEHEWERQIDSGTWGRAWVEDAMRQLR